MSHSFVAGPPQEGATLQELMLYLRPKSRGELSSELRKSLMTSGAPQKLEQENWGLITELGLSPAEFAQMALNRPELWDKEQTEYLRAIADGYPANGQLIELAEDFFTRASTLPPQLELEDEDLEDEEDHDPLQQHERALTALVAPAPALTPLHHAEEVLPVVGDTSDNNWWKKK